MDLTIHISEELYRRAAEVAAKEKRSIEEVLTSAFEQRVVELERLKDRASRGSYEKFRRVMAKVPASPPREDDSF
jgi:hypothetical protein